MGVRGLRLLWARGLLQRSIAKGTILLISIRIELFGKNCINNPSQRAGDFVYSLLEFLFYGVYRYLLFFCFA